MVVAVVVVAAAAAAAAAVAGFGKRAAAGKMVAAVGAAVADSEADTQCIVAAVEELGSSAADHSLDILSAETVTEVRHSRWVAAQMGWVAVAAAGKN